jgi:hypothetical protein
MTEVPKEEFFISPDMAKVLFSMPMLQLVSLVSKHLLFPTVPEAGELVILLSSYMGGSSKSF